MIPTRRLWWWVALGVPIAAVSAQLGAPLIGVAYDVLLLVAAFIIGRLAPSAAKLRITRTFDTVLSVRVANVINLRLENEGDEAIVARVRDEPPADFEAEGNEWDIRLEPGRAITLHYNVKPPERGDRHFRSTFLRVESPFGLVVRQVEVKNEQLARVYPNVLALRDMDLLRQQARMRELGLRRSRSRGLGTEFESLREYAQGDDYRKIDWKASARRSGGKLMVRQFEQERNQCLFLCIDVGRHMLAEVNGVRKLDLVLDSLLMVTHVAARSGDWVGLLVYSDRVRRYVPPRRGRQQVELILEAIHDLVAEPVETDSVAAFTYLASRWSRRALLLNFTDYEDPDRARELVGAFAPMARRHLALLVRVLDPRIDELRYGSARSSEAIYQRAAATMILEDRDTARTVIDSAGIHTIDSEPQKLAEALVNYYWHVKERSLL